MTVGVLAVGGLVVALTVPLTTTGAVDTSASAPVSRFELNARADAPPKPAAAPSDATELRVTQSPLTSDDPVVPLFEPTQCPEGTVPQTVDRSGNESDCLAISSTGDGAAP